MKHIFIFFLVIATVLLHSCVPQRKFEAEQTKARKLENEKHDCEKTLDEYKKKNNLLSDKVSTQYKEIDRMKNDSVLYNQKYNNIKKLNGDLNELYEKVLEQNKQLVNNANSDRDKLSNELAKTDAKLEQREKELREKDEMLKMKDETLKMKDEALKAKENEITKRENDIKSLQDNTNTLQKDLVSREQRVKELETLLSENEKKVNALKDNVAAALNNFKSDELTVTQRDGKVYVSLSEKLLFQSGSTVVDSKGVKALSDLAAVLNNNTDIDVMIEGHTDNVPMKSLNFPKDNWDLSVLRATSIVKILQQNKLDPKRIIASGRSEYFPVVENISTENKAKNRRTEIILAPKLDKIMNLLEK